jgi:protocatechuate 4,5-dioxygenase beta chain
MSHQSGERAGYIDVDFDLQCMQRVINDPEWLASLSIDEIIRKAGTEGVETIMWLAMRGALHPNVKVVHKHYHVPISNTGAGVLVLETRPERSPHQVTSALTSLRLGPPFLEPCAGLS